MNSAELGLKLRTTKRGANEYPSAWRFSEKSSEGVNNLLLTRGKENVLVAVNMILNLLIFPETFIYI